MEDKIKSKIFFSLMLFFFSIGPACLLAKEPLPQALQNVGIEEHIGDQIPLDSQFRMSDGQMITLRSLFEASDTPVILSLVYYHCPMLCHLVLDGLVEGLNQSQLKPGKDYRLISISIDPQNTLKQAKSFQNKMILQLETEKKQWPFLLGDAQSITRVAKAVGFKYQPVKNEFAHAAAIFVLSKTGRIKRYLYGIQYRPRDLKLALLESQDQKKLAVLDKALLFCYTYDPDSRKYGIYVRNLIRAGGAVTLLGLLGFLWQLKKKH